MAKICYFLSINKDWLNPFKCSETMGIYEGKWYMMLVCWTTDYRGWPTDYGRWPTDGRRWPSIYHPFIVHHFRTFKLIQTGLVSLKILVIFRHASVIFCSLLVIFYDLFLFFMSIGPKLPKATCFVYLQSRNIKVDNVFIKDTEDQNQKSNCVMPCLWYHCQ